MAQIGRASSSRALSFSLRGALRANATFSKCDSCTCALQSYEMMCPSCKKLAAPEHSVSFSRNPWAAFKCLKDKPMEFDLPLNEVTAEYKKTIMDLHPDHIKNRNDEEAIRLAGHHSSMLRQSYECLKDACCRANVICQTLYNKEFLSEDSNIEDDDFMTDILMAMEEIEEMTSETTKDEVEGFRDQWQKRLAQQTQCFHDYLQLLKQNPSEANHYFNKIRNAIHISVAIKKLIKTLNDKIVECQLSY